MESERFMEVIQSHCPRCNRRFTAQADTLEAAQALAVRLAEDHERECGKKEETSIMKTYRWWLLSSACGVSFLIGTLFGRWTVPAAQQATISAARDTPAETIPTGDTPVTFQLPMDDVCQCTLVWTGNRFALYNHLVCKETDEIKGSVEQVDDVWNILDIPTLQPNRRYITEKAAKAATYKTVTLNCMVATLHSEGEKP